MGYHCAAPEAVPTGWSRNTETFGLWPGRPDSVVVETGIKDNVMLAPRFYAAVGNLLDCAIYLSDMLRRFDDTSHGVVNVKIFEK